MASNDNNSIIVAFGCDRFNMYFDMVSGTNSFKSINSGLDTMPSRINIGRSNQKFIRFFIKENREFMSSLIYSLLFNNDYTNYLFAAYIKKI